MQNISEKLCKMLGIEPKIKSKSTLIYNKQCDLPILQGCERCEDNFINGGLCKHVVKGQLTIYPNLTEPSNFVKLIENIKIDGIELCDWLICYCGSFCNRNDFINKLTLIIEENRNCLKKDIKSIQQQAQSVDWKY